MNENQDKYYTELDRQLQDIAALDWVTFVRLVGPENIMSAKICILRAKGNSYNQIATRLRTTKRVVQYQSGECKCDNTDQPTA